MMYEFLKTLMNATYKNAVSISIVDDDAEFDITTGSTIYNVNTTELDGYLELEIKGSHGLEFNVNIDMSHGDPVTMEDGVYWINSRNHTFVFSVC